MSAEDGMKASYCRRSATVVAGVLTMAGVVALPGAMAAPSNAGASGEMATSLRLSPSQYIHSIGDIFGDSIKVDGRFEPEQRDQGLLAIGARTSNITDSGLESFDDNALSIAGQVVDARHRSTLIGCTPQTQSGRDDACAREFFTRVGPLLHREPLTDDQ